MYRSDDVNKMQAASNYAGQIAAYVPEPVQAMSEADLALDRLRTIRSKLNEVFGMAKVANEKIIGPAPDKLQGTDSVGKPAGIPQGFMATATQIIGEIDATASEIAEQLSRLHRSF